MKIDSSLLSMISSLMEVAFILLFVLLVVGLLIAARVGYKRGVFKSTYNLLGLCLFVFLALVTLKPFIDFALKFDLSGIIQGPISFDFTLGSTAIVVSEDVTTVEATLDSVLRSFLSQIDAAKYVADVTTLVKTLVISLVSFVIYIVDLVLVFGIGSGILELFWILIFRRITPKIVRKLGKLRFVGMAETMVTYVVLAFLFMSPFTWIVNTVNQGIQKSNAKNSDNEMVQEAIKLVDVYNDSLFARTFFNWNTSLNKEQLTFDTYLIDFFTKVANGGEDGIRVSKDIGTIVTSIGNIAGALGEQNSNGLPTIKLSTEVVDSVFAALTASDYINYLVETAISVALDSNLLQIALSDNTYIDRISLEDVTVRGELDVLNNIADDIVESGIIDDFIDFNTYSLKSNFSSTGNIVLYLDDLFSAEENREKVDKLFGIFSRIDDFNLLNNAIQALGYWGITHDQNFTALKFLGGNLDSADPYAEPENKELVKDFISNIHLGEEIHILLDAVWGIASCGDHIIKNAYYAFAPNPDFSEPSIDDVDPLPSTMPLRAGMPDNEEEYNKVKEKAKKDLIDTLSDNNTLEKFRDCITGVSHMNEDGSAKSRDVSKGEHYALLDSGLIAKAMNGTDFAKKMFDQLSLDEKFGDFSATARSNWTSLMNTVYTSDENAPQPIKFFKTEIDSILRVITNIAQLDDSSISPKGAISAPIKARLNEPDEDEPFEYKDYDSFLEAIVNLFDGWINMSDIPGSLLSLDSRVAPYISELFKCLKPLDDSEIVYALGVPFLTNKLAGMKEQTQEFFDIDICIEQINSNNSLFNDLANFFSSSTINNLQHLMSGLLLNSDGAFDITVLDNPTEILSKLNEKLIIEDDNPETLADETKYDEHPIKYYLAETLKAFYNFEIFNPHSGPNKNLNIHHLFDFIFIKLESFNIEVPSDSVYAKLDESNKWENEFTAMVDLLAVIGDNKLLNIGDFSENIDSALLYSLAGEKSKAETFVSYSDEMPTNLGEVLGCVGDSVVFSTVMGGLLDTYLEGTICDSSLGVGFSNINEGTYWHQEGENMNSLLCNVAQLELDLQNIDLTNVTDVIGLNEMLHSLSNSLIFKDGENNRFGEWLYSKVGNSLNSMSGGLLEDPDETVWKSEWDSIVSTIDNSKYPNQKIAYYDFLVRDGALPSDYEANKAGWICEDFNTKMSAFKQSKNLKALTKGEICDLYKDASFMNDYYNDVLQYDEIGRIINVLANGIRLMDGGAEIDFANLEAADLGRILTALNNSDSLRICSYNAMKIAKDGIGTNEFVDINQARFEFLIDAKAPLSNYALAKENRQIEIDHIVNFFEYYSQLQDITGEELNPDVFFNKEKLSEILGVDSNGIDDPTKTDILTNMLAEVEATYCFNLLTVEERVGDELSLFESCMVSLMEQSGLKGLADIPEDDFTTMEQRVIKISNHEFDGSTNLDGYNSSWVERDGNGDIIGGECSSITGVLKSIIGVTTDSTIDADTLSMTSIKASKITGVMKSVNASYLCTGVMKHFIKNAFTGGMGLEALLKFDSTDADMVANFDLTYKDFGGENNDCEEGTEIYTLHKVLDAMQFENSSGELQFVALGDLKSSITSKVDCLDGVFYFLFNSKILDQEYEGNTDIEGRDVLLYNMLNKFDSYLIGTNKENKMLSIGKMFEVARTQDEYYKIEANGIARIIDTAGNSISGVTVDSLRENPYKKELILNVVRYAFDRNDGNTDFTTDTNITTKRAYFASEIISGIFDNVLESEYVTIATNYTTAEIANIDDYQKFYFASKTNGGRAITANDITASIFDNLNQTELNGLDGMISMTKFINNNADRTGANVSTIADNQFVVLLTTNSSAIKDLFTTKLCTDGVDSRMAKVLYISRGAKMITKETTYADDSFVTNSGLFVLLKYAVNIAAHPTSSPSDYTWTEGFNDDFYSDTFSFAAYGTAFVNYIESCTTVI